MGHACYAGPFDLCNISKCESADVLFGQILVWKKYARLSETCSGKALTNVTILASLFTQWEENEEDGT